MIRKALLLGFFATGGQVLLLRELVSSLNGEELFIGTALFGWLVAVALGALYGGRTRLKISSYALFFIGTVIFWLSLAAVRLCPRLVSDIPGEIIPFTLSAVLSVVFMALVGFVSGMLFPLITAESRTDIKQAVVSVYLFEGIGAFWGGLLIAFTAGNIFSTSTAALALGLIVVANCFYFMFDLTDKKHGLITMALTLFLIVTVKNATPLIEKYLDEAKYPDYTVVNAFDTPYGHQCLISVNDSYTLLTDNKVEAVYPDRQTAENLLLPPLLYVPKASNILLVGRAEFGAAQLAERLPHIHLTALDPREQLTGILTPYLPEAKNLSRVYEDPVAYISDAANAGRFDIIVLDIGEPDNHKNNIYYTSDFFIRAKKLLRPHGILFIPTGYDTDRYISEETARILTVIENSLKDCFERVLLWPGNMTLYFAGDGDALNLPFDSLSSRFDDLPFEGDYVNDAFLTDRLGPMKIERLREIATVTGETNRLAQPLLPHYQALYDARKTGSDERLVSGVLNNKSRLFVIPLVILIFFGYSLAGKSHRYGLMLYFTAGTVSLSLELLSFYIYQSLAGSLYSELALLIGAFMLGLAFGAFVVNRAVTKQADVLTLAALLILSLMFLFTYDRIPPAYLMTYHGVFLFLTAAATGGLFVAASRKYYSAGKEQNRGIGYAWELAGSAAGALLTVTVLLPAIGLERLLAVIVALTAMVTAGAAVKRP